MVIASNEREQPFGDVSPHAICSWSPTSLWEVKVGQGSVGSYWASSTSTHWPYSSWQNHSGKDSSTGKPGGRLMPESAPPLSLIRARQHGASETSASPLCTHHLPGHFARGQAKAVGREPPRFRRPTKRSNETDWTDPSSSCGRYAFTGCFHS